MPPHCDTRDGPVVKAAMKARETGNLIYVLIGIPKESEQELERIFEKTLRAGKGGKDAQEVADDWFFENTIRLHRAGEGAAYPGIKPDTDNTSLHSCKWCWYPLTNRHGADQMPVYRGKCTGTGSSLWRKASLSTLANTVR